LAQKGVSLIYLESLASELRRIGAEADGRAAYRVSGIMLRETEMHKGKKEGKIKPGFLAGVLSTLFSAQSRQGKT
jgi:hypothetical protein